MQIVKAKKTAEAKCFRSMVLWPKEERREGSIQIYKMSYIPSELAAILGHTSTL